MRNMLEGIRIPGKAARLQKRDLVMSLNLNPVP